MVIQRNSATESREITSGFQSPAREGWPPTDAPDRAGLRLMLYHDGERSARDKLKRAQEFENGLLIGSRHSLKTVSRLMGFLTMPQNSISQGG